MPISSPSSSPVAAPVRVLTELDHARVARCVAQRAQAPAAVQSLLDDAELVPSASVAPDIVTMRSRVRVSELSGASPRELTLSYPDEADAAQGQVSVLSPVGTALWGVQAGAVARWSQPDGQAAALRVQAVLFQPEASGDYLR